MRHPLGTLVALVLLALGTVWWVLAGERDGRRAEPPGAATTSSADPSASTPLPEPRATLSDEPRALTSTAEDPPSTTNARAPTDATFVVELTTRFHGWGAQSMPEETVTLELGVGRSRVDLGDPLTTVCLPVPTTESMPLPWSAVEAVADSRHPQVWVRTGGLGILERLFTVRAPQTPGEVVRLPVPITPGVVVHGMLHGPDGEPTAGLVEWWRLDEPGAHGRVTIATPDGRFRGELQREGPHRLVGKATSRTDIGRNSAFPNELADLGTGVSEAFEVGFDESVPFVEIHTSGPGAVVGRLLDEAGQPVAQRELLVVLAEVDDGGLPQVDSAPRVQALLLAGGGHIRATGLTDDDGRFAFRGLVGGLFHVRAAAAHAPGQHPVLLTEPAVPSDGVPLELRFTRPHLVLRVRHPDGSPPPEAFEPHNVYRGPIEWPERPGLVVSLAPSDAGEQLRPFLEARETGRGDFLVELPGPGVVDIGVYGGPVPWRSQRVVVERDAGRIEVDVELPAPAPLGALAFDVLDAQGAPVTRNLRARVTHPGTGIVLLDWRSDRRRSSGWPHRFVLPPGELLFSVEGAPAHEFWHGTLQASRELGAWESLVRIDPDSETRVTAQLGQGARLAIELRGALDADDERAVFVRSQESGASSDPTSLCSVALRLERPGRWPEPVLFARSGHELSSAGGTHLFPSLEFGSEATSELINPGDYTLVATTPGGRALRREISLVGGRTLELTLSFE